MTKLLKANVFNTIQQIFKEFAKYAVDYAVYVGRFQPFHLGHERVVRDALKEAGVVIALVGSAFSASDVKNPFSYEIVRRMLIATFPAEFAAGRLVIRPIVDHTYEDGAWHRDVLATVNRVVARNRHVDAPRIALLGFHKDASSDYLDWFPNWKSMIIQEQIGVLNASDIRLPFLTDGTIDVVSLNPAVVKVLKSYKKSHAFRRLVVEQTEVVHCRKTYGPGPFETSDMLIEFGDEILAIVRGGKFGNGLQALPGGINDGEDPVDCALRELDEEVQMLRLNPWLTKDMLRGWIVNTARFDAPGRDARGDYRTTVVHIRIPGSVARPIVKGDDDARAAHFIKRSDFKRNRAFSDHFHIVGRMMQLADEATPAIELKLAA